MRVTGDKYIQKQLRKMAKKVDAEDVVVGYTQDYAVYVHERTELKHKPGKQAKFLESPARNLSKEMFRGIKEVMIKTGSLQVALAVAGLRLQAASQRIVPRDTSALAASAYTAKISNAPMKAAEARARAVAKYREEMAKRKKR